MDKPQKRNEDSNTPGQNLAHKNEDFCQQMADAVSKYGASETLSCISRFLLAVACFDGNDMRFTCDLGEVSIKPTTDASLSQRRQCESITHSKC